MTIQLVNQIQLAERSFAQPGIADLDPRFVPDRRVSLRELSARAIRSSANRGLRLADRLDPRCQYA